MPDVWKATITVTTTSDQNSRGVPYLRARALRAAREAVNGTAQIQWWVQLMGEISSAVAPNAVPEMRWLRCHQTVAIQSPETSTSAATDPQRYPASGTSSARCAMPSKEALGVREGSPTREVRNNSRDQ